MADTGIFATTAEVQRKVGAGASSTSNVEAYINQFMTEAESYINDVTRYNWSDAYSGLNADVKGLLKQAASNLAAIKVILYDMAGYTNITEAVTLINALDEDAQRAIKELKDKKVQDFVTGA